MRHRQHGRKLGRTAVPRKHLLSNLAQSVILYEKVQTTLAKAKEVRPLVERLITLGKQDTLSSRRNLLRILKVESAVKKVIEALGPRYAKRSGGYTRIVKIGSRQGDAAPMAQIELV